MSLLSLIHVIFLIAGDTDIGDNGDNFAKDLWQLVQKKSV